MRAREAALQMHEQERDRRRRDARNARRLADRLGLVQVELLLHFGREAAHRAVVEIGRQPQILLRAMALDLVVLAVDVAGILRGDLDLLGDDRDRRPAAPAPGSVISVA